MNCNHCRHGIVIEHTKEKRKKIMLPNIGLCDICGTEYIMHKKSGKTFALTVYGATKTIGTSVSLKIYQRITFSSIQRKTIIATDIRRKNISRIFDIIYPVNNSNGILKMIVIDNEKNIVSIVPKIQGVKNKFPSFLKLIKFRYKAIIKSCAKQNSPMINIIISTIAEWISGKYFAMRKII